MKKVISLVIICLLCLSAFTIFSARAQTSPVYFSVEPVAVASLTDMNGSIIGLETPSTPSPVGGSFTVEIHLRNATQTNVPAGVGGVEVHFYFGNILSYAVPTGFTDMIGQPGGVFNGSGAIYALRGFYDANGNNISSAPYSGAVYYEVAAANAPAPWNGADGMVAKITFEIIRQLQGSQGKQTVSFPLALVEIGPGLTDGNIVGIPHDIVQGTLTIDAAPVDAIDNSPAATQIFIGEPNYVDPVSGLTYVTQYTPFTLLAIDTWSGVSYTTYHIYNSTYDGGWQNYTTQFVLDPLEDGNYTIEFYSVDNVGNVEATNSTNATLHWLYGDINHDGQVGLSDLVLLAKSYGSSSGGPKWNRYADLAASWGIIDLTDLVTLAAHYGQTFHP